MGRVAGRSRQFRADRSESKRIGTCLSTLKVASSVSETPLPMAAVSSDVSVDETYNGTDTYASRATLRPAQVPTFDSLGRNRVAGRETLYRSVAIGILHAFENELAFAGLQFLVARGKTE
jgi:hypothetical protein